MKRPEEIATAAWPVLVALGAVMLLWIGLMAFDIAGDLETEAKTNQLVDKALRSVTLADDLRRHIHALATGVRNRDAEIARITQDMTTYDPLATYADERGAWTELQGRLGRLLATRTAPVDQVLLHNLEGSLDRIVDINEHEAARNVAGIVASFHEDYMIDAIGGGIGVVLAVVVGAALLRSSRRHRALLGTYLAMKDQRANELEAFAGRVAHDLRGPLGPIHGYAQLLQHGGAPEELGQRIEKSVDRMAAIIDDLLTLSISGQAGAGESELAPVVAQVLDDAAPELAGAEVERVLVDASVRCSRPALCRIVQNLISNAIKYRAPERPLELCITATRDQSMIELAVSDNGIGMDEDTAAHAFDPLFRGDATRAIPGHGLGLAIVKRTVDALGGTVWLASTPGEGTRIAVRLPVAETHAPASSR